MAIVKMKKLRLLAVRSQREELLRDLMLLGCVEVTETDLDVSDPEIAPLLRRESTDLPALRASQNRLLRGLKLLDRCAPGKKKLLAPRPEVSTADFLDDAALERILQKARELEGLEDKLRALTTEENRQKVLADSLRPWAGLDWPLEKNGTASCSVLLGTMPATVELSAAEAALLEKVEEAQLSPVNADKEQQYVTLICFRAYQSAAIEVLRGFGFSMPSMSGLTGTAGENIARIEARLAELQTQMTALTEEIAAEAVYRDEFKLCLDRVATKIARAEAAEKFVGTDTVFALSGWMTAPEEEQLAQTLSRYDCAWETRDPTKEETKQVPIKLKNGKVVAPINMVTEMYSLPSYDGIDPNPLMFFFFVFYFGFMFADIAYGIIILLAGILLKKLLRPKGVLGQMAGLAILVGISTTICGFLTGGLFGDVVTVFSESFLGKAGVQLWAVISPLQDPMTVLIFGIAIGCVHLIYGQCIHIYMGFRDGEGLDAILDVVPWWLLFIGIAMIALGGGAVMLIVGVLALICTQGRHAKGFFRKLFGGIKSLYDITSWLSDVLSYSRLMALMLATSVIASVVNILGALPGSVVIFVIIFLIGHSFNLSINIIGTYVHAARLQYLEFFGKFYKDGGIPFRPLHCKTKYVDVVDRAEEVK